MIYSADYPTTEAFIAALNKEFIAVGDMHVVKAEYQLDRKCQIEDTFTLLQQYQKATDTVLFETGFDGFEDYVPPIGYRPLFYEHSSFTAIINPPTAAPMGSNLNLLVIPGSNYAIANLTVNLSVFDGDVEIATYDAVADSDNEASFSVAIPVGIGPLTIKTSFTGVPSNQVFVVYAGEILDADNPLLDISPRPFDFFVTSQGVAIVIGDYNGDGTLGVQDLTLGLGRYPANRLDAKNHLTATLTQDYYYPGLIGGSLTLNIRPKTRPLNKLVYAVYLHDADQTPAGQRILQTLTSDYSIIFNNLDAGYVGNLYANITVYNAYNTLTFGPTLAGYTITVDNPDIEPGSTKTLNFVPSGIEQFQPGSTFNLQLPWNPQLTLVTIPNSESFTYNISVPQTYDQDAYVAFSWANPIYANRIYLIVDNSIAMSSAITVSKYVYAYNQNDQFTVNIFNASGSTYSYTIKMYNGTVNPANLLNSNTVPLGNNGTLAFSRSILPSYTNSITVVVS